MPAATLRPVVPKHTNAPPVMYSQQWSPVPSTTACAMLLRTANRSPARAAARTRPVQCLAICSRSMGTPRPSGDMPPPSGVGAS